ncbi:uncharacterized protein SPAPADRAFT_69537 [Spathaspora passalidarum NRRL Y-27907]|uniref:Uncharacterized protein n=1 Tax=Spathaspora passalidarum (strain NRRL Y-27907 / 11-Y1) TaxID=619300 RepID=G3AGA0_SPAPN|nr:uncharacterized protein SPAPADRAFT_69537 [Spathaspora passalidarum NRRL Y-27907]EGW35240.1 hypothetical protein SPAPADRAFT_69537 [Spathaspora passalidarum NRRL Y-27907]
MNCTKKHAKLQKNKKTNKMVKQITLIYLRLTILNGLLAKNFNTATIYQNPSDFQAGSKFCKLSIQLVNLIFAAIEASKYHQLLLWRMRTNTMNILFTYNSKTLDITE